MIHHHRRYNRSRFSPLGFGILIFVFFIVGMPLGFDSVITIVPLIFVGLTFFLVIYLSNRNSVRNQARTSDMPNNPYEDRYSTNLGYSNYGSQQSTREPSQNSYKSTSSNPRYCAFCGNQLTGSGWSENSQETYSFCQHCGERNDF